ncbi:hypothetical protein Hanom_Chr04g00306241 [Helianthus anomalus]
MSRLRTKCAINFKPRVPSMYFSKKLGTKCVTKCKPHGPSVYFWKTMDQIQNFGKPH